MKKFLAGALLALMICLASPVANAQVVPYNGQTRFGAIWDLNNFGRWALRAASGSSTAGTYSLTFPAGGYVTAGGAQSFTPFKVGVRIKVGINTPGVTNQETVVITAVNGCGVSNVSVCTVTAVFAFAHGAGAAVVSGTCGLDEGVAVAVANNGGIGMYNTFGGCPVVANVTSLVTVGSTALMIEVFTNPMPVAAGPVFYTWKGAAYTTP